jgi:hypothetical protein
MLPVRLSPHLGFNDQLHQQAVTTLLCDVQDHSPSEVGGMSLGEFARGTRPRHVPCEPSRSSSVCLQLLRCYSCLYTMVFSSKCYCARTRLSASLSQCSPALGQVDWTASFCSILSEPRPTVVAPK